MEKGLSYFDLAENDYQFLQYDWKAGRIGNIMCSAAQNICERYLKHIIDTYVLEVDTTSILQTHSLRALRRFITEKIPNFKADWRTILQADGYYFSTRYPGDSAFLVGKDDVDECWESVEVTRLAALQYIKFKELEIQNSVKDKRLTDENVSKDAKQGASQSSMHRGCR